MFDNGTTRACKVDNKADCVHKVEDKIWRMIMHAMTKPPAYTVIAMKPYVPAMTMTKPPTNAEMMVKPCAIMLTL